VWCLIMVRAQSVFQEIRGHVKSSPFLEEGFRWAAYELMLVLDALSFLSKLQFII
jgi:hypothetical protein